MKLWQKTKEFTEVDPDSMYEDDVEQAFLTHAGTIFPEFITKPFRVKVHYGLSYQRPDLVMVGKDCGRWFVVEVEKVSHSLQEHVLPQVETFQNGEYGSKHAAALFDGAVDISLEGFERLEIESLMREQRPEVLVVADSREASWEHALRAIGVHYLSLKIFRSIDGQSVIGVEGDVSPIHQHQVVAECRPSREMPALWEMSRSEFLGQQTQIDIHFQSKPVTWEVIPTTNKLYLSPKTRIRVHPDPHLKYQICKVNDRLEMRKR